MEIEMKSQCTDITSSIPSVPRTCVWDEKELISVTAPYDYTASKSGKGLRTHLLTAFAEYIPVDENSKSVIGAAVGMLHSATLMIDDIEDGSTIRRGSPCAHLVFGVAQTINAANHAYFVAQQSLLSLEDWPTAMAIYNEELLNLHLGQGIELLWREGDVVPTEDQYLRVVHGKTGALFRLIVRLMINAHSGELGDKAKHCLAQLANILAAIHQVLDDYSDFKSAKMHALKGNFAGDITEGKFTFPIIHALRNSACPNDNELMHIMRLRSTDTEVKTRAMGYMEEKGSFAYTRSTVQSWHEEALRLVDQLGGKSQRMMDMIDAIIEA